MPLSATPLDDLDDSEAPVLIGAQVRALRKAKGLTLSELAARTGKSIGYLSQIECDRAKPAIKTLQVIGRELGVQVGWFFRSDEQEQTPRYVIRPHQQRRLSYTSLWSEDYLQETNMLISPDLDGKIAFGITTLAPGASSGDDAFSLDAEIAAYVLEGELTITIEGDTYVLKPGDAYCIPEGVPHQYQNVAAHDVKWLWSITPPRL